MVITIEITKDEITPFLRSFPKKFERAGELTVARLAKDGRRFAQRLAPHKTNELRDNITVAILNKRQAKVMSVVTDPYPYNLWVNASPGYEFLDPSQMVKPFFSPKQKPFRYGDPSAKSFIGHDIKWTGTPKFFDIAFEWVLKEADSVLKGKIQEAMK